MWVPLTAGEALTLQRQLNFSRDAEREAVRVGLQFLIDAGFDTSGLIAFFAFISGRGTPTGRPGLSIFWENCPTHNRPPLRILGVVGRPSGLNV